MLAGVLAAVVLLVVVAFLAARSAKVHAPKERAGANDEVLTEFVVRSLELHALADVLADAAATAMTAFGAPRAVVFEPGARDGAWDAWAPGPQPLEAVPDAAKPAFAWLKHNAEVIALDEVSGPRFGAMRIPLGDLASRYAIDHLVPLVDRRQVIAVLGLSLGRKTTGGERALLDHLRVEATAAAANVRLHREAAHKLTLEKEVDLASAVQRALVPTITEAASGGLSWVGHVRASGQAGSDFWCSYDLAPGKLLVVVGDVIGSGLAGSMASAVAKSCCDALAESGVHDPGQLLTALSRALWRPQKPLQMTCIAVWIDAPAGKLRWANAGHPMPYFSAKGAEKLTVLPGSGPMLGDLQDAQYTSTERPLAPGDFAVVYTDGVVEAMNAQRAPFGERRLQRALAAARTAGPAAVRDAVLKALGEFRGNEALDDDELLVVLARP